MRIGHYELPHSVFAAPMAGVTDRPYRNLVKQLGAAYAVSEMVTSRADLRDSLKTGGNSTVRAKHKALQQR